MGCVFQENSDKVVKTPPNSSFLWLLNEALVRSLIAFVYPQCMK
jgi:hypothetical protein